MAGRVPDMCLGQPRFFDLACGGARQAVTNLDLDRHHEFCHDFSAMRVNGGRVQPVPGLQCNEQFDIFLAMRRRNADGGRILDAVKRQHSFLDFKCRDHFTLYPDASDMRQEK